MPTNLAQWQTYLESLDPTRIELGLERVQTVFKALKLSISSKIIVVAGTNGKGSTVSALQALFLSENATVGSYVSPHLQRFNERICFQGSPVNDGELIDAFQCIENVRTNAGVDTDNKVALTYFEFTTLAAIKLLSDKQPDYLIFEVGLGGRLDAVNILDADIAIVTGVALDHTDWLGDDLESIGFEKAGIYRSDKPAIYASSDCPSSVLEQIRKQGANPYVFGEQLLIENTSESTVFTIKVDDHVHSLVLPEYSLPPASLLAAISAFVLSGFELSRNKPQILAETSVKGRYQYLAFRETKCILDVAHNAQAAIYLAEKLSKDKRMNRPIALVGTMSDKPLNEIFDPMVGVVSQWLLVQPDTPRASSLDQQRQVLIKLGVNQLDIKDIGLITVENIENCLAEIEAAVVFGSFYTVGEFLDVIDSDTIERP